jgi:hypothetical protein
MQKTIYIKDEDLWREIRAMADGQSISGYLVSLHRENVERQAQAKARAATIEEERALVDGLPDLSADLL